VTDIPLLADPERNLALAYAPRQRRLALQTLWLLDERLGTIVAAAREPAIGAMRLLWWRDALVRLDDRQAATPAEPLLSRIAAECLTAGVTGVRLSEMEEGWSTLLDDVEPDAAAIRLHGMARGGRLFAITAALLGADADGVVAAGEGWALADLGHRLRDQQARAFARQSARERLADAGIRDWPRALRPLGMLALLAQRDAALPEAISRRQGAPGRVLRAMLYGVTGY
jgi:phytoene synthase